MGELKSAWEIAQERANRLGKLSAEEQKQQARQRCRQIGQVVAQKWLDSDQQLDMTAELNRHEAEDRDMIKQAVIEHLVEALEFPGSENMHAARKAIEGISSLGPEVQPEVEELRQLFQEYEETERKMKQELESHYRETLHRLRISGTAIAGINIEADPEWQLARQSLLETFAPRLNDLKRKLTLPT